MFWTHVQNEPVKVVLSDYLEAGFHKKLYFLNKGIVQS